MKSHSIRVFFLLILISVVGAGALAGGDDYNCIWTAAPLTIDGADTDWQGMEFGQYKRTKIDYAFKNDANYLYVLFKFTEPSREFLSSIAFTGIKMYINPQGKKNKDYSVTMIKKQLTADEFIADMEKKRGTELTQEEKDKVRANPTYINHEIKIAHKDDVAPQVTNQPGIKPALFRSQQQGRTAVIYEFAIPLERAQELAAGVGAEAGKRIKVGFEWGGATKEWKEAQAARSGAQSARGTATKAGGLTSERTDARGGSGSLEGGPGIASMRRMMPKRYSFWVDVQLAIQQ